MVRQNYDLWREVFLLAVGQAGLNNAVDAIDRLCPRVLPQSPGGWQQLCLAGRALAEVGLPKVRSDEKGPDLEKHVKRLLYHTMRDTDDHDAPRVPIRTRADAGEVLDELGWLPPGLNAWVHVPGGPLYLHHSGRTETVPDFWVAKYPVTNTQYQRFIEAGGYNKPDYWPKKTGARGWWEETKRRQPYWWDDPTFGYSRRSYPVVGVTWYEALAYRAWLTELLEQARRGESLPQEHQELVEGLLKAESRGLKGLRGLTILLPSEAEWVRAAGGEGDGNRYPWQPPAYTPADSPLPRAGEGPGVRAELALSKVEGVLARANVEESGLGHTTPVAMYPAGAFFPSPESGIMDLAGNVWEWTRDIDKDGWVWLRGGSWWSNAKNARVGSRNYDHPDVYLFDGFRVCARWLSSGS